MKIEKRLFIKIIIFFAFLIVLFFLLFISRVDIGGNNKAVKHFNKGNFELASQTFGDELKKNPQNYTLISNSAGVDYKLSKFDQAGAKYTAVINSTDTSKEDKFIALYDMGNVEFKKNNFKEAIDLYKEALKINPSDKDAKYNLEVSLLKLNKGNNHQNNKDDNKNNDKKNNKQKQQEQNLKKQMEENDKAQKENEKKQQETNDNSNTKNNGSSGNGDEKQKRLEKERKELDKQKQEISNKIKDLMNSKKKEEKQSNQKQNSSNKEKSQNNQPEQKNEQQQLQMKKDENKDMQAAMLLNYYNEADRNANRVKNRNKKSLVHQSQEDW